MSEKRHHMQISAKMMRSLFALNASLLCVDLQYSLNFFFEFLVEKGKMPQWFNVKALNSIQSDCVNVKFRAIFWNSIAFAAIAFINPFQQIACRSSCLHHHMHIWLFSFTASDTYHVLLSLIYCFPCIPVELSVQILSNREREKNTACQDICHVLWHDLCSAIESIFSIIIIFIFFPAKTFIIFLFFAEQWALRVEYINRCIGHASFLHQRKRRRKLSILEIKFNWLSVTGSIRIKNIVWIFKIDDTHWFD